MTNKEAKEILLDMANELQIIPESKQGQAFKMALKLFNSVDKIRTEIDRIEINGQVDEHTMFIRTADQVKKMVLDIIDKYIAESEE